jgi:hypothetical protein
MADQGKGGRRGGRDGQDGPAHLARRAPRRRWGARAGAADPGTPVPGPSLACDYDCEYDPDTEVTPAPASTSGPLQRRRPATPPPSTAPRTRAGEGSVDDITALMDFLRKEDAP